MGRSLRVKVIALLPAGTASPRLLSRKRTLFIWLTRERTRASRTLIRSRARWPDSLRCLIGLSKAGSARPSRASIRASSASLLVGLLAIARTLRALATSTS